MQHKGFIIKKIKSAGLFSFCFSFTELQLGTVSKAFHITLKINDGGLSGYIISATIVY